MQAALGDLDVEPGSGKAALDQHAQQLLRKPGIAQLHGRDVDRQRQLRVPRLRVLECQAHQAFGNLPDQVDLLGDRDEDVGAHQPELRRSPARQHLEPDQLAGADVDLLLVVGNELARRDALANADLQLVAEAQLVFHRRLEPRVVLAAVLLGLRHCDVGLAQQRLEAQLRIVEHVALLVGVMRAGKPDRQRSFDRPVLELYRHSQRFDQVRGEPVDRFFAADLVRQHDDEFVAAEAGEGAAPRNERFQPPRGFDQHLIAGLMPVDLVDLLEVVDPQQQQRDVALGGAGGFDQASGFGADAAAVEQAGQNVGFGQALRAFLGQFALADFLGQIDVAPPAEDDQRDVEDQGVRGDHFGAAAHAQPCVYHARHDRPAGADEQDDRGRRNPQPDHVAAGAVQPLRLACFHAPLWLPDPYQEYSPRNAAQGISAKALKYRLIPVGGG